MSAILVTHGSDHFSHGALRSQQSFLFSPRPRDCVRTDRTFFPCTISRQLSSGSSVPLSVSFLRIVHGRLIRMSIQCVACSTYSTALMELHLKEANFGFNLAWAPEWAWKQIKFM